MSDSRDGPGNFLQRWSRRKQTAATREDREGKRPNAADTETRAPSGGATALSCNLPTFNPASLPPIESITAASNIRPFLAPGVPVELSRAALRRAWTSDPAIRDFVGLAENQWDFSQPDGVPGFGSLEMTPELRRMLAQLIGDVSAEPQPSEQAGAQTTETSAELPPPAATIGGDTAATACVEPDLVVPHNDDAATQTEQHNVEPLARRRHGSAIPR
jgi:hypothetical protein